MHHVREDIVQFKEEILREIVSPRHETAVINGTREVLEDHEHCIAALERRGSS